MAKDIIKYIKNINRKPSVPRRLLEQFKTGDHDPAGLRSKRAEIC